MLRLMHFCLFFILILPHAWGKMSSKWGKVGSTENKITAAPHCMEMHLLR